jgi:hypothetical protein
MLKIGRDELGLPLLGYGLRQETKLASVAAISPTIIWKPTSTGPATNRWSEVQMLDDD